MELPEREREEAEGMEGEETNREDENQDNSEWRRRRRRREAASVGQSFTANILYHNFVIYLCLSVTAQNQALMEQVSHADPAAGNTFLKRQLVERNAVLAEVSINLKKEAVFNVALLEETIVLKKKLNAAVIKEHVAEKATLEKPWTTRVRIESWINYFWSKC